jgi:hypothetical protein
MLPSAQDTWQAVLKEAKLGMGSRTYDRWLTGSEGLAFDGGVLRVGVLNEYAREWLDKRLRGMVERVCETVTGTAVSLVFEVMVSEVQLPLPGVVDDNGRSAAPPNMDYPEYQFGGFVAPRANYVQVPKDFIYLVAPNVRPTVTALVLFVLAETVGVVVDGCGNRRREWVTTYPQARLMLNFGYSTIYTAVWEARAHGLIVQRWIEDGGERRQLERKRGLKLHDRTGLFALRPRWADEPIDYPLEPKSKR